MDSINKSHLPSYQPMPGDESISDGAKAKGLEGSFRASLISDPNEATKRAILVGDTLLSHVKENACARLASKIPENFEGMPTQGGASGGYYILDSESSPVAVFKPTLEEYGAPNNPRGHAGNLGDNRIRSGIASGTQAAREALAYRLDHGGKARVPVVANASLSSQVMKMQNANGALIQILNPREGKFGLRGVDTNKITPSSARSLMILDMRVSNTDRNPDNVYLQKTNPLDRKKGYEWEARAFDHGCILSTSGKDQVDFCWMDWSQASTEFDMEDKQYIAQLSPVDDAKLVRAAGLPREASDRLLVNTAILQAGAQVNMTPEAIARHMHGPEDNPCYDASSAGKLLESAHMQANLVMKDAEGLSETIRVRVRDEAIYSFALDGAIKLFHK